jgi:purine catabolism regulator
LLGLTQPSEALAFAELTLAPLESLDGPQHAQLVRTLEAYLRYGGVAQRVAHELRVHVNTVGYRLQRIRALSGLDLDSSEVRLGLQVAFRIRGRSASIACNKSGFDLASH